VPLAIGFMALICLVFSALGTAIGSMLQNMQGFQLTMNFLVLPIFFLSGALFPLDDLPAALSAATRLDPLTYGIDGLRGALIGASHFGLVTDAVVLAALASAFLALGAWAFSRIQA
jgi:ABC-2 type transport system permease protein